MVEGTPTAWPPGMTSTADHGVIARGSGDGPVGTAAMRPRWMGGRTRQLGQRLEDQLAWYERKARAASVGFIG